jgi:hypothetical protein
MKQVKGDTLTSKVLRGTLYRRTMGLFGSFRSTYLPSLLLRSNSQIIFTMPLQFKNDIITFLHTYTHTYTYNSKQIYIHTYIHTYIHETKSYSIHALSCTYSTYTRKYLIQESYVYVCMYLCMYVCTLPYIIDTEVDLLREILVS